MPTYTIFAGVNGAGKTSIYKSIHIRVRKGGYGIPDKFIERRYYDSLKNLNDVIEI